MRLINVAVAVITDDIDRVLITRRPLRTTHGGMWEFPGGKLEEGELASTALVRELKEEIGVDVLLSDYLGEIHHSYDDRAVSLFIYHVSQYRGEPQCCEDQMDLKWADIDCLHELQFPAANAKIIELFMRTKSGR